MSYVINLNEDYVAALQFIVSKLNKENAANNIPAINEVRFIENTIRAALFSVLADLKSNNLKELNSQLYNAPKVKREAAIKAAMEVLK